MIVSSAETLVCLWMSYRNAAAVSTTRTAIARQERDLDVVGETAHGLVAGVVEDSR